MGLVLGSPGAWFLPQNLGRLSPQTRALTKTLLSKLVHWAFRDVRGASSTPLGARVLPAPCVHWCPGPPTLLEGHKPASALACASVYKRMWYG